MLTFIKPPQLHHNDLNLEESCNQPIGCNFVDFKRGWSDIARIKASTSSRLASKSSHTHAHTNFNTVPMESTVHSKAESIVNLSNPIQDGPAQHTAALYRLVARSAGPVWCASASLHRGLCAKPATSKCDDWCLTMALAPTKLQVPSAMQVVSQCKWSNNLGPLQCNNYICRQCVSIEAAW